MSDPVRQRCSPLPHRAPLDAPTALPLFSPAPSTRTLSDVTRGSELAPAQPESTLAVAPAGEGVPASFLRLTAELVGATGALLADQRAGTPVPVGLIGTIDEEAAARALAGGGAAEGMVCVPIQGPEGRRGTLLLVGASPATIAAHASALSSVAHAVLGGARPEEVDPVTGLLDGPSARRRIDRFLVEARRDNRQYALLICDIADFHAINSAFGRAAGDRILRIAGDRIRNLVPRSAIPLRVHGDVFGVFMPVVDRAADIDALVSTLATGFVEPVTLENQEVALHLVFGTAVFPHRASSTAELFDRALLALRRAQERRTGAEIFTNELEERLVREVAVEQRLRSALQERQLSVVYQPKIRLATRRFYAVEALSRWTDPDLGFVSPAEFIPAAERTGLVVELGRQVIEKSLRDVARMRTILPEASVSVNVAAEQLTTRSFVDEVLAAIERAQVDPSALELELTESSIIENLDQAVGIIRRLTDLGVACSIDDFGTGYSSLAYLRKLPVRTLKLDRTFLAHVTESQRDADLVKSIVSMAHVLGFDVVAEGVEEEVQAELLMDLGCDAGQGYLWAKPSPLEQVLDVLADGDT